MQTDEVKYVQRRVRPGPLDVHPTEKALVVNYELEATVVGELGDTMLEETKECQKIIRVKSLNDSTDISALAQEIVEKCSLIPQAKVREVEQLLFYLQTRKEQPSSKDLKKSESSQSVRGLSDKEKDKEREGLESIRVHEMANINCLDDYIELLYEDMTDKIRASALVLQLSRNPDNLAELACNETLLGALGRVLREDGRKSIDLSTNIVYVFFCFSTFSEFHPLIAQLKIGSLCMDIIEYELNRHEQWKEDLTKKRNVLDSEKDNPTLKRDYEKSLKKYQTLIKKQDQLLRVSYYLLLNIAEDTKVELKMVNRGIVSLLLRTLDRDLPELLILVVSFLKKLSIFVENKNEMAEKNIVEKVARLVHSNHDDLLNVTLKLLLNLSFDLDLRNAMVKVGLLPKLVKLICSNAFLTNELVFLSQDIHCFSLAHLKIVKLIMECPEERVPLELIALSINLTTNKRNAQIICESNGLTFLMKHVFEHQDPLLMKMIRNVSQHEGPTKTLFLDFVDDLAVATQQSDNEEFVLECLGVLGNLSVPDLDFERLLKKHNLLHWMEKKLIPGVCEDDLVLEVVVLIGTVVADESCARFIAKSGILKSLIELLNAKQEDDEVVLQIVYVFHHLIKHPSTQEQMIKETQAPAYLIDLLHDTNPEIRKICDSTLDVIAEHDEEWAKRIQLDKFRWHNSQWLDMVQSQQMDEAADMYIDEQIGPFIQESDILEQSDLMYSGYDSLSAEGNLSPEFLDASRSNRTTESAGRPMSRYKNRYSVDVDMLRDRMSSLGVDSNIYYKRPPSVAFVNGNAIDNSAPNTGMFLFH
ncbi:kinesin-associated protein 3-like [Limulus polyphemus]|uniref:Kinesin-associated protein 3-like n=1 Tax=Limulus polyphemus TaxID=6850 RepID=A0ABM1S064_LIMPO|nr:kinesin-associated protein 3-like [Limulus polyphemus]